MSETSSRRADPQRRGLLVVVGLLSVLLVVAGVFVVKALVASPSPADAATRSARDGARAIEAGLEAAATYQREKKFTEAAAILEKLSEQSPTDRAVRIAYAQALIGLERYALAYKEYEAAIALGDSSADDALPAANESKESRLERRAREMKRLAGHRDPTLAALHFEAGTCANMADIPDRAEEHYWMAQVLDPGEARYPLYLSMIHIKKGDDDAAMADLVRAVKLNPDLAEAWGTMAELELKKNQGSLSLQHIETARKLQPEVARWMLVQARALNRQLEPEKAAAILEALSPSQRDKAVLEVLAESYGMLRTPRKAAEMYEAAWRNASTDAELAATGAQWWHRAGDDKRALPLAKTAAMMGNQEGKELVQTITGNKD
jgi:tetratricopeptide (TPR) repeat protein